jgi:hypothetical protein
VQDIRSQITELSLSQSPLGAGLALDEARSHAGSPSQPGEDAQPTGRAFGGVAEATPSPHPESLARLVVRLTSAPQGQHVCAWAAALVAENPLATFVTRMQQWDYLVPLLDIGVISFWVPGVILFLFGYPLIFGWWSMLLLPITLAVFGFLQRWQARHVFRTLDIHPQSDKRGFLGYLVAFGVLTSAAALRGYGQHIVGVGRRWS